MDDLEALATAHHAQEGDRSGDAVRDDATSEIDAVPAPATLRPPGALALARGVCRCLSQLGSAVLSEFRLANGRRADIVAIDAKGLITIVEIKSSVEDFRADQKWPEYLPFCDAFYFAVSEAFPAAILPDGSGLLVADAYGAAITRPAPPSCLGAARRRSVTLRFARVAARRLHRLADPLVMDGVAQDEGVWG